MKKLIIPALCLLFASCTDAPSTPTKELNQSFTNLSIQNIRIVEIDGCEYIFVPYGNASWGSHKGNCKFCAQRKTD